MVLQKTIRLHTQGRGAILDLTAEVERVVRASGVSTGVVNVAAKGSTVAITTIEFEPGAVKDLQRALDAIAPMNDNYAHNATWGDHNGYAHLRSALLGTTETYPVSVRALLLGTWQQIVLCDFDERPRERSVTVTVLGE